jgi:alpha-L-rhamnosidase
VWPDTQANLVRALAFDLVPEELRQRTADRLVQLVRDAGTHLRTGFLATPYLLPVLADTGHADVAYELLLQDTSPSWLAMIDRGATTVWERWEGVDAEGRPHESLNHYSKGAVISFLHRYTGGIRLEDDPAYRSFTVRPVPGGGLTEASAVHDSPFGRIESAWRVIDGEFALEVTVPSGTSATVVLPDGSRYASGPGRWTGRCAL